MDLYSEQKLSTISRKILIAIEDYLRMNPEKGFADALMVLNISDNVYGQDAEIINRIGMSEYGMLITRQ